MGKWRSGECERAGAIQARSGHLRLPSQIYQVRKITTRREHPAQRGSGPGRRALVIDADMRARESMSCVRAWQKQLEIPGRNVTARGRVSAGLFTARSGTELSWQGGHESEGEAAVMCTWDGALLHVQGPAVASGIGRAQLAFGVLALLH
jgi:hypothetical protein